MNDHLGRLRSQLEKREAIFLEDDGMRYKSEDENNLSESEHDTESEQSFESDDCNDSQEDPTFEPGTSSRLLERSEQQHKKRRLLGEMAQQRTEKGSRTSQTQLRSDLSGEQCAAQDSPSSQRSSRSSRRCFRCGVLEEEVTNLRKEALNAWVSSPMNSKLMPLNHRNQYKIRLFKRATS